MLKFLEESSRLQAFMNLLPIIMSQCPSYSIWTGANAHFLINFTELPLVALENMNPLKSADIMVSSHIATAYTEFKCPEKSENIVSLTILQRLLGVRASSQRSADFSYLIYGLREEFEIALIRC